MAPNFVPRERKHKRLAKQKQQHHTGDDSNRQEIVPATLSEQEGHRIALQKQLRDAQPSKVSSKKRKRLDKYVDTKLKKEENLELLKKLAAHKVDTSLLQSSKKLGRVHENKRERLQRALRERGAGLDGGDAELILFEPRPEAQDVSEADSDVESDSNDGVSITPAVRVEHVSVPNFGSGLKRPLATDVGGQPLIKRRKRRKQTVRISLPESEDSNEIEGYSSESDVSHDMDSGLSSEAEVENDDDEWNGFDSDADVHSPDGQPTDVTDEEEDAASDAESTSPSSTSEDAVEDDKPGRVSAFKAWADTQRNVAMDFTPSVAPTNDVVSKANFKPRRVSPESFLQAIPASSEQSRRPADAITMERTDDIQAARLELPVVQEEQRIIEAINNNPVVVICGATGSGKTTQVPQMLFENGYGSHVGSTKQSAASKSPQSRGLIGITQPRRVAATSVADRVAHELGPAFRNSVAHQVRYDTNVSSTTAIKFMTDGMLLREIQQNFSLSKYSCIVIDEAHERSVNTDILIGMLSRIVDLRSQLSKEEPSKYYPLKLIIMSATLRTSDFLSNTRLFRNGAPPVVEAEGRQYSVTVHFNRRTSRDYLAETIDKVTRGHKKLPPGGMLIFLTGQQEIQTVAKRLRQKLGGTTEYENPAQRLNGANTGSMDADDFENPRSARKAADYLEAEEDPSDAESEAEIITDDQDAEFDIADDQAGPRGALKPYILPLYAALPSSQQLKVFQPAPEGHRLIVLATDVAETSLTIPGIRYVFDSGRSKEKKYEPSTGVQTFEVDWISQASASQRTGRAGRTGPGHCYRLYSSAVYEQFFAEHTVPEILRTPLESVVLQLKGMDIENVVNFPFPTPPDATQLQQAERLLKNLGAIDEQRGTITDSGKELTQYPLSPRYGKMLCLAKKNAVVAHAVALVAGLAVGELFIPEAQDDVIAAADDPDSSDDSEMEKEMRMEARVASTAAEKRHQAYTRARATLSRWDDHSDIIKLLTAVAAHAEAHQKPSGAASFCSDFFLREKGMAEVQQLRQQLHSIVNSQDHSTAGATTSSSTLLALPSDKERALLNQVVAAGFIDQVAIRADALSDSTSAAAFGRMPRRAIEVPYRTLFPSATAVDSTASAVDQELQKSVFIHPSSVLARLSVHEMPQYIVYSHLSQAAAATVDDKQKKTRFHPLTSIGPKPLAVLAESTPLLEIGKPIGKIEELPEKRRQCWVGLSLKAPSNNGIGWPIGAWKVLQRRGRGSGDWEVEKVLAR